MDRNVKCRSFTRRHTTGAVVAVASLSMMAMASLDVPAFAAAKSSGTVTIGYVGSLSGSDAYFGVEALAGVNAAVAKINASGGADGKKLVVKSLDDKGDPTTTRLDFTELASNGVKFVVSGSAGSNMAAAESVVIANHMITFNPVASDPDLAKADARNPWYFMITATNPQFGIAMAQYTAKTLARKTVGVFELDNVYSQQVVAGFAPALKGFGGRITKTVVYPYSQTDFSGQVAAVLATHPSTVFLTGFPDDSNLIAKAVRADGFTGPIIGTIGLWSSTYQNAVGKAGAQRTYIDTNFPLQTSHQTAVGRSLIGKLGANYGVYSTGAYDAVTCIQKAIAATKTSANVTSLRNYILKEHFVGASGHITFAANGQLKLVNMYISEFAGSSWRDLTSIPLKG